ncbi:hypothetical protein JK636_14395 [Clostridium sp. YIM B02515]|uniref:Uncharacterized protein n=1 Tax=Clostridium rhizosphaerae TaxID=2803861 RepID=A0ABS1TCA6_9CLOT|nr:hypothetical protein [Clostridium rhizosphaerae]MBL4936940.1 hypothetical protein [Clostridium rhizosphaerae]
MNTKNEFLKEYTKIPEKKEIRTSILAIAVFTIVCGYMAMKSYYDAVPNSVIPSFIINLLNVIIISFELFSLIFYIFAERMNKLIYLYTSVGFTGSSIFFFIVSSLIFLSRLDSPLSYVTICICLLIYLLIIAAVVLNIRNKIKRAHKKNQLNKALAGAISSLCISLGIILSKQPGLNGIPSEIILLVLAYLLIPTCSGFHKFYLIIKNRDK